MVRRHEDWMRQARRKLESGRWDLEGRFYEDACFSAQQAAELAAKAWLESQGRREMGHSVLQLLEKGGAVPLDVQHAARVLDGYYIPPRYVNGFAAGAPMDYYDAETASAALNHAERIIRFVAGHLEGLSAD